MKKIISFSLWGENPIYNAGAIKNAELAKDIYPDWTCRYYLGKSTPFTTIQDLSKHNNTEIFIMNDPSDWTGMFWRFYPASGLDVDIMISRDADSRLNLREKAAVDEWLESPMDFHIMRDHPQHATEIMGGMWGVRNKLLIHMLPMIQSYVKGNFWQVDQNFLREHIYPLVRNNTMVHDEYFEKRPFPSKREPKSFVGQAFDENDEMLHPEHADML
jgi:hypothetical protein